MHFAFVDELSEVFSNALGKRVITPVLLGAVDAPANSRRANNVVALRPSAKRSTAQRPARTARNSAAPKRGR
jgi:hypothetical protein